MKNEKNRPRLGRPPTTGTNKMIAIRWSPALYAGINKYASKQMLQRPDALRQIVAKFLVKEGLVDPREMFPT